MRTDDTAGDWEGLSGSWLANGAPPTSLDARVRRRVRRHAWLMRLATAGDVLAAVALAGLAFAMAGRLPASIGRFWLISVLALALGTGAFNLWNRHGLWRPVGQSTIAFLDLSLRRARAKLRLVRAVRVLLAIELVVAGAILLRVRGERAALVGVLLSLLLALVALVLAWSWWYARRVRREIAELTGWAADVEAAPAVT